jgi:uncharacterized protein DUF1592/uncharacterized protein DUF1588/uncharacterized protein DUF1595/uncharacterized protein DUF1585
MSGLKDLRLVRQRLKLNPARIALLAGGGIAIAALGSGLLPGGSEPSGFTAHAQSAASPLLIEPSLRLISQSQYIDTIQAIFGPDVAVKVRFAPVRREDGLLAVGASDAVLTSGALDPLEASARAVAEQVIAPERRPFLIGCQPANPKAADPQCARSFFAKVGRLLYRRPLSEAELNDVVTIAGRAVGPSGDFYDGLAYALSGMLVSPEFLFVREAAEPDPNLNGTWRLDGYSKASRLSFLLWNAAPDDELLAAAARGDLHKPAELRRQVDRMLASPLYQEGVRAFFTDFFVMEAFDTMAKDAAIYPGMTLKAIGEAREQILRTLVDHLVTQHADYRDLFTTRRTFISADLGMLYRLPINTNSQGWVPYEFPASDPRAGILTQIGFLAQYAHPGRSSATRRGRAIREVLLCQKVPDPPPNVDFSNFEASNKPFSTARARLTVHQENPVCAGCHRMTDPIGLGLENFDGAGQFRPLENGAKIDASGTLDGTEFTNATSLGLAVRNHPALKSCIVSRLYSYSIGHKATSADEPKLEQYVATLDKQGYRFDDMLRLIVLDKGFFAVKPPPVAEAESPLKTASSGGANAHQN